MAAGGISAMPWQRPRAWSSHQDRVPFRVPFLLAPSLLTASARHNINAGLVSYLVCVCQRDSQVVQSPVFTGFLHALIL